MLLVAKQQTLVANCGCGFLVKLEKNGHNFTLMVYDKQSKSGYTKIVPNFYETLSLAVQHSRETGHQIEVMGIVKIKKERMPNNGN